MTSFFPYAWENKMSIRLDRYCQSEFGSQARTCRKYTIFRKKKTAVSYEVE